MIQKKERKLLFVEAAIFLIIIYLLIIGLTFILDKSRINELENQLKNYELKHESFLATNTFYESMGKQDCEFSKKYILDEYDDIKELSLNIASFKNRILSINEKLHDSKKKEYIIAQTENLNKIQIHNSVCENKIYPLFYFVDGDITGFNQQSLILQQFAMNYKEEVIIYIFDLNYDEELIINLLQKLHNVTNHNTIIFGEINNINGGSINIPTLTQELIRLRES